MNQTETYLNAPVKNCTTCAHYKSDVMSHQYDLCLRFGAQYCSTCVSCSHLCGTELREWRPRPPKPKPMSVRQWLYDVLWRKDY